MKRRWHRLITIAAFVAGAGVLAAPIAYGRLFPEPTRYADDEEHFKRASVGVEPVQGVPYEVWRTLPGLCMKPEERDAGFRRFGVLWEHGAATPIGMPLETAIVQRVGINCALCHVGKVDGVPGYVVGAPNTGFDLQSYLRFLTACTQGPNFTAAKILAENDRLGGDLNPLQKLFYRTVIIPQMKSALAEQARQLSFMNGQPDWGPGRTAGFQPAKVQVLGQPFDGTLDIVDIPPLWNLRARAGHAYHWDGVNRSRHEVFLNSGIGNGASAATINVANLSRMERYTLALPSARYPWPIDQQLAAAGQGVFAHACADCHAVGGAKNGQVIPIAWLGTDRNRLDALTPATVESFSALAHYAWRYEHFRKTNGYVAAPLDGIWARAPYLHNGSVPTLAALLTPPAGRPVRFVRGSTRYDPVNVGFANEGGRFVYDTRLPGNANAGHLWGTDLAVREKRALIEYLKTQ